MRGKEWLVGLLLGGLCIGGLLWLRSRDVVPEEPTREVYDERPVEHTPLPDTPPPADPPAPPAREEAAATPPPPEPAMAESTTLLVEEATPPAEIEPVEALPHAAEAVSLTGVVRSLHGPVAGVRLTLQGLPEAPAESAGEAFELPMNAQASMTNTVSDEDGAYLLSGFEPGEYTLQVTAAGALDQSIQVRVRAAGTQQDIMLEQGEGLTGIVVDNAGRPLAGINVAVHDWSSGLNSSESAVSAEDGSFELHGLSGPQVNISVTDPEQAYVGSLPIVQASVGAHLTLRMQRAGGVLVEVFDTDGQPLPGVTVKPEQPGNPNWWNPTQAVSDSLGMAQLTSLLPGRYTVTANLEDYTEGAATGVEVRPGEEARVEITLGQGAVVRGQVVDKSGRGLEGVAVVLAPRQGAGMGMQAEAMVEMQLRQSDMLGVDRQSLPGLGNMRLAYSDAEGNFSLAGLADGANRILAISVGYQTTRSSVQVEREQDPEPVRLVLELGGSIAGRVLDSGGQPLAAATVTLMSAQGMARFASSNEEGAYSLEGLPAGKHTVMVYASGSGGGMRTTSAQAEVELGATTTLDIRFSAGLLVRGRLLRAGQPVEGAMVQLLGGDGGMMNMKMGRTIADGSFEIADVQPGDYQAFIQHDARATKLPVTVPDGDKEVQVGDLEIPSSRIAGTIVSTVDGLPIAGAQLMVAEDRASAAGSAMGELLDTMLGMGQSDGEGHFELEGMQGGNLMLQATATGYAPSQLRFELLEGAELLGLRFELQPGVQLTGTVVDAQGQPAPATLGMRDLDSQTVNMGGGWQPQMAEADGSFELNGLTPGHRYAVVAQMPGLAPARAVVLAQEGVQISLALSVPGQLKLQVAVGGEPVAGASLKLFFPDGGYVGEVLSYTNFFQGPPLSDATGLLQLAGLAPGDYTALVSAGEHSQSLPVRIVSGRESEAQVELLEAAE